jgi:hypothetical protein
MGQGDRRVIAESSTLIFQALRPVCPTRDWVSESGVDGRLMLLLSGPFSVFFKKSFREGIPAIFLKKPSIASLGRLAVTVDIEFVLAIGRENHTSQAKKYGKSFGMRTFIETIEVANFIVFLRLQFSR